MSAAALLVAWRADGLRAETAAAFDRVMAAFPVRVRALPCEDRTDPEARIRAWVLPGHPTGAAVADLGLGGWIAAAGNPTPSAGALDLGAVAADLARRLDTLSPPFALIVREGGDAALHVAVDRCGLQHLYLRRESDGTVWIASSLLALVAVGRASLDADAAAVWLAAGHHLSERTLVREIRKLAPGERLRCDASGCSTVATWAPDDIAPAGDEEYRASLLTALRASNGNGGTALELTGGLDSRLVLAGSLAAGLEPRAWTMGNDESAELRTVRRLQRIAAFPHIGVPVPSSTAARLPDLVSGMHALADGEVNALEYAPLLVAFDALEGRRTVSVSGSGGEIARGYYYGAIHGGTVHVDALARKIASATGPATAALRRDRFPDPHGPLRAELERVLAASPAPRPEGKLEDVYIRARMQRFGGRNISTTGMFCRQALPFFDNAVVAASLGLPPERKRDGLAVRSALTAWAPALARVPLDSGIAVAPRSWRAPRTQVRWGAAMGRKAIRRYGGSAGRRLSGDRGPVPWDAIAAAPRFREFVRDMLPPRGARVHELVDPVATNQLVERALLVGSLYPLGLVLTLELTLRQLEGNWTPG